MPPVILNGSAGVTTNSGAVYDSITRGTAVASTSGTNIDFTGIPSWVKRITVMFSGVSLSGSSNVIIQLGTSGGFVTSGYLTYGSSFNATAVESIFPNSGVACLNLVGTGADTVGGAVSISNLSGNSWVSQGSVVLNGANGAVTGGNITLAGVLDRIRIASANGTDTFDAGLINIMYE